MTKIKNKEMYELSPSIQENYFPSVTIHTWDYGRKHALPLWMEFVSYSKWHKKSKYTHFRPNNTALEIPIEGDMSMTVGSRTQIVRAGEMIILPAGEKNQLRTGPSGFCWKLSCGLCGSLVEQHLSILHFPIGKAIPIGGATKYIELLNNIGRMLQNKETSSVPEIAGLTLNLLIQLSLHCTSNFDPLVGEAIRIMEFNISRNIKLEDIVAELKITREKLNRIFKQETGFTPKQYLIHLRMKNAECFLIHSKKTVKDIAFLTGYSSPQKFSKEFFKKHQMSPRNFRYVTKGKFRAHN